FGADPPISSADRPGTAIGSSHEAPSVVLSGAKAASTPADAACRGEAGTYPAERSNHQVSRQPRRCALHGAQPPQQACTGTRKERFQDLGRQISAGNPLL